MVDPACLLTALTTFTGNLILVIYYLIEENKEHWNQKLYADLQPAFLMVDWHWRMDLRQLEVTGKMITAISWVIMTAPILSCCVVLSQGGKRLLWLHCFIAVIAMAGAVVELCAQLMNLGCFNAAAWMVKNFTLENWASNADEIGWQALEVAYRLTSGMIIWIDATEYLAMGFIFLGIFFSARGMGSKPQGLGMLVGGLAFFIGCMAMADFIANVVRFRWWDASSLVGKIIAVMNRVILVPLWFLILSCRLPTAVQAHVEEESAEKHANGISNGEESSWTNG